MRQCPSPPDRRTPTLTLFCGLPGAGKSTLARRLEHRGHGVRLSTDEWQADLAVASTETDFHERLQRALYRHALVLLRAGVDVILEDGLWTAAERSEKVADARGCAARIELHVFDVDLETLLERLRARNDRGRPTDHRVSEEELRRAWALFEPPSAAELGTVDSVELRRGGLDD